MVIIVSGVTGAGKSQVAKTLARKYNGVVLCGDSVQLNRGCDILTTKNSDVLMTSKYQIADLLDANKYIIDCRKLMLDLISQGKTPIIDGGSWFYISHLLTGSTGSYSDETIF